MQASGLLRWRLAFAIIRPLVCFAGVLFLCKDRGGNLVLLCNLKCVFKVGLEVGDMVLMG